MSNKSVFTQNKPPGTIQINPDEINWLDAPVSLPTGSKVAFLEGNPKQEGIFTMRVKLLRYCKMPVHSHPQDERVTIISGMMYIGFGKKFDMNIAVGLSSGSFYINPAESEHYVFTENEECVLQVTGLGPWIVNYLGSSD